MQKIILTVNCVSLLFSFISFFTPWLSFSGNSPSQRIFNQLVPGSENTGALYLYQSLGCTKVIDGPSTGIQKSCALIEFPYLPDSLGYIYTASNVVLVFMSLSLPFQLISTLVSYFRLIKAEVGFPWLDHRMTITGLSIIYWIFHVISFATYSGQISSKFNIDTDGALLGFGGTQNRAWLFGGGFGLCVVSCILSTGIIYLDLRFGTEVIPAPPPPLPSQNKTTNYRPYASPTVVANPLGSVDA